MGKFLALMTVIAAIAAGGLMYYLQVYAYYEEVDASSEPVVLTTLGNTEEPILAEAFQGIDSDSSPLRYRACFTTPHSQAMLSETYIAYENPVPTTAPGWFDCFDAQAIGAALESGAALAFLSQANVIWGFDRVVAVTADGAGYAWHQMNHCGKEVFEEGRPAPENCPPRPDRGH